MDSFINYIYWFLKVCTCNTYRTASYTAIVIWYLKSKHQLIWFHTWTYFVIWSTIVVQIEIPFFTRSYGKGLTKRRSPTALMWWPVTGTDISSSKSTLTIGVWLFQISSPRIRQSTDAWKGPRLSRSLIFGLKVIECHQIIDQMFIFGLKVKKKKSLMIISKNCHQITNQMLILGLYHPITA